MLDGLTGAAAAAGIGRHKHSKSIVDGSIVAKTAKFTEKALVVSPEKRGAGAAGLGAAGVGNENKSVSRIFLRNPVE